MGGRYPERNANFNMDKLVAFRIGDYQYSRLQEYSEAFNMGLSEILREAVALWININYESLKKSENK